MSDRFKTRHSKQNANAVISQKKNDQNNLYFGENPSIKYSSYL